MDEMTLRTRLANAEAFGSRWLADANEAAESGHHARAEKLYDKAQFWLDHANSIRDKLFVIRHGESK